MTEPPKMIVTHEIDECELFDQILPWYRHWLAKDLAVDVDIEGGEVTISMADATTNDMKPVTLPLWEALHTGCHDPGGASLLALAEGLEAIAAKIRDIKAP